MAKLHLLNVTIHTHSLGKKTHVNFTRAINEPLRGISSAKPLLKVLNQLAFSHHSKCLYGVGYKVFPKGSPIKYASPAVGS